MGVGLKVGLWYTINHSQNRLYIGIYIALTYNYMEGEVKLTIKIDKKNIEYIIYNPKHIPHKGECISFSHIKDDDDEDASIAIPFEVDFVDYEYNIKDNTLNVLILLE